MAEGASSPEPPTPAPTFVPPPPSPVPRPAWRSGPVVVVLVVLVVGLLLAVVLLGPFSGGSGSSGGSSPGTFSGARGVSDSFASAHGSWTLVEAIGVASFNGTYLPFNGTTPPSNCTFTVLVGSVPDNVSIPEYRGNLINGQAPVWLFGYTDLTSRGFLAVLEVGGSVVFALEESAGCGLGTISYHGISSSAVDSTTAVAAAAAAGGYAFLRAHPSGVSLEMGLIGGVSFANFTISPSWQVEWTTCGGLFGVSSGPSSGYAFMAAVNATTGTVLVGGVQNTTCGIPPNQGIGGALTIGGAAVIQGGGTGGTIASQGCTSGDYCYSLMIEAVTNVTPNDFSLRVTYGTNGTTSLTPVGYAIVEVSGAVLVYSMGPVESAWTNGVGSPSSQLSSGMTIVIDMGTQNPSSGSWVLQVTGLGPYVNSGLSTSL